MRTSVVFFTCLFSCLFSQMLPADCCEPGRFGVEVTLATPGVMGIGPTYYTENFEVGVTISGRADNARESTKTVTPAIFGGLRYNLCEGTYFAYGLNVSDTFGTVNGKRIKNDISAGVYISLEQMLTSHLMLVFWVDPYAYEYQKFKRSSVSTQNYFSAGGIGLTYLF